MIHTMDGWVGSVNASSVLCRPPKLTLLIVLRILDFRCIYTLIKGGRHREFAVLAKLFEGFLDDGPQFVLRLVVVVLFGIGTGKDGGEHRLNILDRLGC